MAEVARSPRCGQRALKGKVDFMKKLSMFSWGFAGWGNATPQLIAAVDAAERKRGFNPPIFVDIRFKRTGRAKGFKDHTFEDLLGWRRYRWMPTLGSSAIVTRKRKTTIAAPKAARQLLDMALEASDRSARVIFFLVPPTRGDEAIAPRGAHPPDPIGCRGMARRAGVFGWPSP